jgi:hypothetical protein
MNLRSPNNKWWLIAAGCRLDGKISLGWVQTTVYENLDQTLKNEFYRVRPSLTGD